MAGGGFSRHMSDTIRNNKNLLRRKSMFKKERTFLSLQKEDLKPNSGKIEKKKISSYELSKIREKTIKQSKEENAITFILVFMAIAFITFIGLNYYKKNIKESQIRTELAYDNHIIENLNEYTFLIDDGDKWIEKRNWKNAIYRYGKQLTYFPMSLIRTID